MLRVSPVDDSTVGLGGTHGHITAPLNYGNLQIILRQPACCGCPYNSRSDNGNIVNWQHIYSLSHPGSVEQTYESLKVAGHHKHACEDQKQPRAFLNHGQVPPDKPYHLLQLLPQECCKKKGHA